MSTTESTRSETAVTLRLVPVDDLRAIAASETPAAERFIDGALPPPFVAERALRQLAEGKPAFWCSTFYIVRESDGYIVGGCGFKDEPYGDRVEIGYAVAPACMRQGIGSAAVGALLELAFQSGEASEVLAQVEPSNVASTCLVRKLGFIRLGIATDEDGTTVFRWLARQSGVAAAAAARAG